MRDYIDGRLWAEHGHIFSQQAAELIDSVMLVFCRLQRIEFDAPWRTDAPSSC